VLRAAVSQHRKFLYLETVSTCDGQVHRSSRNDDDHQKTNVEFVWPRGSRAGWQYRLPNYSVVFGTCATRIYHIFAYFFILFQKWKCSCHGAFNVNLRLANHATHFFWYNRIQFSQDLMVKKAQATGVTTASKYRNSTWNDMLLHKHIVNT